MINAVEVRDGPRVVELKGKEPLSRPFLVKKEDTTSPTSFHRVTQDGKTMRSKDCYTLGG